MTAGGGLTHSPRTEYRVVCADGTPRHADVRTLEAALRDVEFHDAMRHVCNPHLVEQRTIYTTPWMSTPARTPS